MNEIRVYTAQRMTGRYQDEMRAEADMLVRAIRNYGFIALNPVIEENIPLLHELLPPSPTEKLEAYWRRDKEMIREADVLLDYDTQNHSDGANKEVGYSRWCLWKPTVRVWSGPGGAISQIEDDIVVKTLPEAMSLITTKWGTYAQLAIWRKEMWGRCFHRWLGYQVDMNRRYGMTTRLEIGAL